jgi:predicted amidohydrolase
LLRDPRVGLRLLTRAAAGLRSDRGWEEHLEQWLFPFRQAARRFGVYVCPGSTLLPMFRREPAGRLVFERRGLANTSCLIAPNGRVLGFRRKLRLTPLERRAGIAAGDPAFDLLPFDTELGRIGVAVCLDGFYRDIVDAFDAQGCRWLLQPSANSIDWNAELPRNRVLQSEEWLHCGAGALIQGCEHIRAVYNPMCATRGRLLRHSGRSAVWVNRRLVQHGQAAEASDSIRPENAGGAGGDALPTGLIAIAESEYTEELVCGPLP